MTEGDLPVENSSEEKAPASEEPRQRRERKPMFTGEGRGRFGHAAGTSSRRYGVGGIPGFAVWTMGVGVILFILAVYGAFFGFRHSVIPTSPDAAARYLKREGPAGIERIVATLANPGDKPQEALSLLKLMPHIDSPELRARLVEGLPRQVSDICFISLALCLLNDERGLPRMIELLRTAKADEQRICSSNLFLGSVRKENPLISHWGCDSDLLFTVTVVESTLRHTFPGETLDEKRTTILDWWKENSKGELMDWEIAFLASENSSNRARAFEYLAMRADRDPELQGKLVEAMQKESDPQLSAHMVYTLFRSGVPESLPMFDDLLRNARTAGEVEQILAVVRNFVKVPSKFIEIDTWRDGRDDTATFAFLLEWWDANYQFMEFDDYQWAAVKVKLQ